ncbi:hypothetical protein [uncultured Psychroserpens sp.]|uniref:hypothetical protein n=1 Tax=uncultured Psychroserpens sp. TaxID=255436 RepID=UPI00260BBD49|nr:hypothetical protein [uncultured Psychroserpens sp.]
MNKLFFFIAIIFLCPFNTQAQEAINNYKYIIVQNQYDFQKSEDQYQLNSLTKFLFNKYGYEAFLDSEEYPKDLGADNCLGLKAILKDVKGGFLKTKIQIDLVDCKNNVIATSQVGSSKVKDFKKAHTEAVREAFITYQYFDYKYNGSKVSQERSAIEKETQTPVSKDKGEEAIKAVENEIPSEIEVIEPKEKPYVNASDKKDLLYAQPIDNGFQIVDTEPKKVMILLNTGAPGTFIVQGKDAVVYKKDGIWFYAENSGENLTVRRINLKF